MANCKQIAENAFLAIGVVMAILYIMSLPFLVLGVNVPALGFSLLVNRPGLANRSFGEQYEYGAQFELFKAVIGWRQISMSDVIQLARFGTKEDIEPYVDYVTWLNANKDEFQRKQLTEMARYLQNPNNGPDEFYGMWNRASVANTKWAALHCRLEAGCEYWNMMLLGFYEWFALRGTDRSSFHTLDF